MLKIDLNSNPCPIKQDPIEFEWFVDLLYELDPVNILEIGTWMFGTSWVFFQFTKTNGGHLWTVDLDDRVLDWASYPKDKVTLILGDSTHPLTMQRIKSQIPHQSLDLLFIDGNHGYSWVRRDYLNYRDLVRPGGFVAFHDIQVEPGVQRVWNDIKDCTQCLFIISSPTSPGIGVQIVPPGGYT